MFFKSILLRNESSKNENQNTICKRNPFGKSDFKRKELKNEKKLNNLHEAKAKIFLKVIQSFYMIKILLASFLMVFLVENSIQERLVDYSFVPLSQIHSAVIQGKVSKVQDLVDDILKTQIPCKEKFQYLQCIVGKLWAIESLAQLQIKAKEQEIQDFIQERAEYEYQTIFNKLGEKKKIQKQIKDILTMVGISKKIIDDTVTIFEMGKIIRLTNKYVGKYFDDNTKNQWQIAQKGLIKEIKRVQPYILLHARVKRDLKILKSDIQDFSENGELQEELAQIKRRIQISKYRLEIYEKQLKKKDQRFLQIKAQTVDLRERLVTMVENEGILAGVRLQESEKSIKQLENHLHYFSTKRTQKKFNQVIDRIQREQFNCNNIQYKQKKDQSFKLKERQIQRFIHSIFGQTQKVNNRTAFQNIIPFLHLPYEITHVNIFSQEWANEYSLPQIFLFQSERCCDETFLGVGDIDEIQGQKITIQLRDGNTLTLMAGQCSQIFQINEEKSQIFFSAGQKDGKNIISSAIMYGGEFMPENEEEISP